MLFSTIKVLFLIIIVDFYIYANTLYFTIVVILLALFLLQFDGNGRFFEEKVRFLPIVIYVILLQNQVFFMIFEILEYV